MLFKLNSVNLILIRSFHIQNKPLPVIKVPTYINQQLSKVKRKEERIAESKRDRFLVRKGNRSVTPLITCADRRFNHYLGQTYYPRIDQVPLFSRSWKMGQKMVFNPYDSNPSFIDDQEKNKKKSKSKRSRSKKDQEEEEINEKPEFKFDQLGLDSCICDAIKLLNMKSPTQIQWKGIPAILSRRNLICSAETGSGKTIAYLAPLFQMIMEYKKNKERLEDSSKREPKGLVIVPSRELAEQVGLIAKKMSQHCGVNVAVMLGGGQKSIPKNGIDLVITTIGCVQPALLKNNYKLKRLNHIIIDEADTLFDDTFSFDVLDLLHNINIKQNIDDDKEQEETVKKKRVDDENENMGVQVICVSATMPTNLDSTLGKVMDVSNLDRITTNSLHRIMPHVRQEFIRLERKNRDLTLLEMVKKDYQSGRPVMIFCNRTPMVKWMERFLRGHGIDCIALHKQVPNEERLGLFMSFQEGHYDVIACTDLGSRGLDTTRVEHVINFDSPHFVSDYIHRAGRTGRVGSNKKCLVTSFISFTPDKEMVKKLELSLRLGGRINLVDGNIRGEIKKHAEFRENRSKANQVNK